MRRLAQHLYLGLHRLKKSARLLFSLENLVLLLLSASFGYSLLSLMVHIVDREGDSPMLAQISPDGKLLLQIRQTGLAILDAESGRLNDELRLVSPWQNAFLSQSERDRLLTRAAWSPLDFRRTTILQMTTTAKIVLLRLHDNRLFWWNRETRQHRLIPSPNDWWAGITLDEGRNRFYVRSLRPQANRTELDRTELDHNELDHNELDHNGLDRNGLDAKSQSSLLPFNAIADLHGFELNTGKETQIVQAILIGQPVQSRPDFRVRAHNGAIELLRWPAFPDDKPTIQKRYLLDPQNFEDISSYIPLTVRFDGEDLLIERLMESPHVIQTEEDATSRIQCVRLNAQGISTSTKPLNSPTTQLEILDNISGYAETDYYDSVGQPIWRVELISGDRRIVMTNPTSSVLSDLRADYGLSAAKLQGSKIRLARDDGAIFDIDFNAPDKTTAWKIPLLPHRQIPRDAIAAFLAGALLWLAYAYKTKCLFAKQGWVVLISLFAWPLLLAGLEQGFALELPATLRQATLTQVTVTQVAIVAIASIPLLACTLGLFLAAGRSRAIALAPWFLLVILSAGAIESVAYRESASFLEHFGIRLSWKNE